MICMLVLCDELTVIYVCPGVMRFDVKCASIHHSKPICYVCAQRWINVFWGIPSNTLPARSSFQKTKPNWSQGAAVNIIHIQVKTVLLQTECVMQSEHMKAWSFLTFSTSPGLLESQIQTENLMNIDSLCRRQSQLSIYILTLFISPSYSHVSAPTGPPQVRYAISYYYLFLKDYFTTTDPLHICNLILYLGCYLPSLVFFQLTVLIHVIGP
jgi:hypothetical protein